MFWCLKYLSINSIKVRSWPNPYKVGTHPTHLKRWNKSHQTILSFSWFFDRESRWYKVTFSFPSWRSLNFWKGHLTIPKSSPRIARYMLFLNCSWLVHDKLTIFSAALASGRANLFNRMRRDSFSSSCQTRLDDTKMLRIFGNWGWFSTQLAIAWVGLGGWVSPP